MNNQETNSAQSEQVLTENPESTPKNPCQGYLVDPETKLHLCNACEYHKHRNETKPWLK